MYVPRRSRVTIPRVCALPSMFETTFRGELRIRTASSTVKIERRSSCRVSINLADWGPRVFVKPPLPEGRGFPINEDRASRFRDGRC